MGTAIVLTLLLFFIIAHTILIENYRRWFLSLSTYTPEPSIKPIHFSVIVPARNEELQIAKCIHSILTQEYLSSNFEVIIADDYSRDRTPSIVRKLMDNHPNLKLLQMEQLLGGKPINSYKKKAIELAIQNAQGDWIVTTDADCIVPEKWLSNLSDFIGRNNSVFVAAPVRITNTGSFVSIFQCLDFISLQGITAASVHAGFHTMCNGANLAYNKRVFYEVDGFKGIDSIASGDDMLLMHKIYLRYKNRVHFLFSKDSVVDTLPMPTWRSFLNQRIRWASKADRFDDKRILVVLFFNYLFNLSFVLLPFAGFFIEHVLYYWLVMLILKTLIDLRFMVPVAAFFNQQRLLWYFPLMQPIHILYTVVAGWLGKFGKYSWKGRVVK